MQWADYGLCKVDYDHAHEKIIKAKVVPSPSYRAGETREMTREEIIQAMKDGKSFVVLEEHHNRWKKAGPLYLVEVDGEDYVRMRRSQIPRDSHRGLPEY